MQRWKTSPPYFLTGLNLRLPGIFQTTISNSASLILVVELLNAANAIEQNHCLYCEWQSDFDSRSNKEYAPKSIAVQ